jgi:hypothetical protein
MRAAGLCTCGALAVLATCLVTPAAAAPGLEPGVHLDPGSPAVKEYVLPLNQARQTGSASSSKRGSSTAPFGAGITPPNGGAGAGSQPSTTTRVGSHTAGHAHGKHVAGAAAPAPVPIPSSVLRAARSENSSDGSGSLFALLGGGLAILVIGGFGGTVLRHSRRPRPSG